MVDNSETDRPSEQTFDATAVFNGQVTLGLFEEAERALDAGDLPRAREYLARALIASVPQSGIPFLEDNYGGVLPSE